MLQKVPLSTTSSKSATSKSTGPGLASRITLETPIQYLKGVGPKLGALLESKGISTIRDALFYFPRDYQDRSQMKSIASLQSASGESTQALVRGKVISHSFIPIRRLKRPMLEARIDDGTGVLAIKWFQYNRTFLEQKLKNRPTLIVYGTARDYSGRLGMVHPDIEWLDEADAAQTSTPITSERILPVYSETEGLTQKTIRKVVQQALQLAGEQIVDEIPEPIRESHRLVSMRKAVRSLHEPEKTTKIEALRNFQTPEQQRLIFDEFFKFEWVIGRRRLHFRSEHTKPYPKESAMQLYQELQKRLPFELTEEQKNSIAKIFDDIANEKPMNRLLQGDVGCGKTLVAFSATLPVIAGGGQAAIMAPTEILAEQHLKNARSYLENLNIDGKPLRVELLTGSTPKAKREEILTGLQNDIHLLIGTHALIEDPVQFRELGLVIIDEQHRFGVDQRMRLRSKGQSPHVLSLTATPIPRTLALTAYGDLDVSVIRQLPKGRPDVFTKIAKESDRLAMYEKIRNELKIGHQAYIIYPLVEESEKIDLANAVQGAEELANGPLKGFRIGLLHGRMKSQEKADVMNAFKEKKVDLLVSTTVVEVGVDVPNATVLVVEHAERFGLSQLHQLRGRIGRGTQTSYCFLSTKGSSEQSFERLRAMEQTRDGFKLAELDLEIRGPGQFLGTRQSGELQFQFASLVRDQLILQEARKSAFDLLKNDPELVRLEHAPLRNYMLRKGHLEQSRFETA